VRGEERHGGHSDEEVLRRRLDDELGHPRVTPGERHHPGLVEHHAEAADAAGRDGHAGSPLRGEPP
jgi:hypothetical protein